MSARDVQLSIIEGMDRPVGPILPSVFQGTNADLIAAVAPLYLTGSVLDVTYGNGKTAGGWWKRFTPDPFTFHDIDPDYGGVDFRCQPHADGSFDTVCFDPPYVPAGGQRTTGPTAGEVDFRKRFGLMGTRTLAELNALICDGLTECARVTRGYLLVKCSDFVTGSKFTLGHLTVLDHARSLGLDCHDLIVHHTGSGPGGHNITTVKRARRHHSYLLVFTPSPLSLMGAGS